VKRRHYFLATAVLGCTLSLGLARAADAPPTVTLPRADYEKLLQRMDAMEQEMAQLKKAQKPAATPATAADMQQSLAETKEVVDDLVKQMKHVQEQANETSVGLEHLLIAGDAYVEFDKFKGHNSNFSARFSPMFLYQQERLLVEAGFDATLNADGAESAKTTISLNKADASYIVNDYVTVGGGFFPVPFGQYHTRLDPKWINPLPDDPLVWGNQAPNAALGAFVTGAVPVCTQSSINYCLYVTDGPELVTQDPGNAGALRFDANHNDFDVHEGKAYGGRLGFVPWHFVEVGYSIQYGNAAPSGMSTTTALVQAVDLDFTRTYEQIAGMVTLRADWVWSSVQDAVYDPTGTLGYGPLTVNDNNRNGGSALLAYRPTLSSLKFLRDFEPVVRYDWFDTPLSAPGGAHEDRITVGLDYWLNPRAVLKVAYEFDHRTPGPSVDALMVQLGLGL